MFFYKKSYRAIQYFIDEIRNENIYSNLRVLDEIDSYLILIDDTKSDDRDIVREVFYKSNHEFKPLPNKTIYFGYTFNWVDDEDEIERKIKDKEIKDITKFFKNVNYQKDLSKVHESNYLFH